jgi:hypothetical protein
VVERAALIGPTAQQYKFCFPLFKQYESFNAGIKSLRATLPDENFYRGVLHLEPCISLIQMRKKPTNVPIIHSVY